jgi:hypothetical protein
MADIVRCAGQAFVEHSRKWINWQHRKVLLAIERCRTAALGGHRDRCTGCLLNHHVASPQQIGDEGMACILAMGVCTR